MEIRFVPLDRWPGVPTKPYARQRSRFATGWSKTIDLLERELNHLRSKEVGWDTRDSLQAERRLPVLVPLLVREGIWAPRGDP